MSILLIIFIIIALLIIGTTVLKVSPFISFVVVSIIAGFLLELPATQIVKSLQKGIGDMLGSIIITLSAGAMMGKLIAESGAGTLIANKIMSVFGEKYIAWGLLLTGLIIGIPLFYNVGFVLVIPIIFSLVGLYGFSPVIIAIPILAALSIAHSLLPPHPSPASLVGLFHASMTKTFIYGLIVGIPAGIFAGPLFAKILAKYQNNKEHKTKQSLNTISSTTNNNNHNNNTNKKIPTFTVSIFSALLPVILLLCTFLIQLVLSNLPNTSTSKIIPILKFIEEPSVLMMISLIVVSIMLGTFQGMNIKKVMGFYEQGIKEVATILLIIGASGGLKQIMLDAHVGDILAQYVQNISINPLLLGWLIAATIRVLLGSATVAGLTATGIIIPLMPHLEVDVNLMILAIGSGSIFCSHVNDTGFWMFKEYFNLSIKETFLSWSIMESVASLVGLAGILVLSTLI